MRKIYNFPKLFRKSQNNFEKSLAKNKKICIIYIADKTLALSDKIYGGLAERSKAAVLKTSGIALVYFPLYYLQITDK